METQAIEIIETEIVLEEAMSFNHSRLIHRLSLALAPFEDRFDVLPELEFELSTGRLKPGVALLPKRALDWEKDVIRCPDPPFTAIEILSPTQALSGLVTKIREYYFPAGVASCWLILPELQSVNLYLPGQPVAKFTDGTLNDPASQIEISIEALFR